MLLVLWSLRRLAIRAFWARSIQARNELIFCNLKMEEATEAGQEASEATEYRGGV